MKGDELRRIRQLLRLTQAALGRKLKVDGNTVSRWERGIHPIRESIAFQVRALLREEVQAGDGA